MESTFADRLWWSRHKAGLGATKLARMVDCAQSTISALERGNAAASSYNDKFAKALAVDPVWLAHGQADRAPEGFDEKEARQGRENQGVERPSPVRLPASPRAEPYMPRWMESAAEPTMPVSDGDVMLKRLINLYMDYVGLAGPERAQQALEVLRRAGALVSGGERAAPRPPSP